MEEGERWREMGEVGVDAEEEEVVLQYTILSIVLFRDRNEVEGRGVRTSREDPCTARAGRHARVSMELDHHLKNRSEGVSPRGTLLLHRRRHNN